MFRMSVQRGMRTCVRKVLAHPGLCSVKCRSFSSLPTLMNEVLHHLDAKDDQLILDMTFGSGAHSASILKSTVGSKLLALDRDPHAYSEAQHLSEKYPGRLFPLLGCFSDLPTLLNGLNIEKNSIDGILLDVGCSDFQLSESNRGFDPNVDGLLDMRMDCDRVPNSITAADILTKADELDLHKIFRIYGQERLSKKLARDIVTCRYRFFNLESTFELKAFIQDNFNNRINIKNIFYALRAFVNNELNELNFGVSLAQNYLKKGGRLVVLTYHPIEDLIVKRHLTGLIFENNPSPLGLKYYSQSFNLSVSEIEALRNSPWKSLSKHVITAPGSYASTHSAKLRAAVRVS